MGCAGTREPVKEEPVKETKPQYDESFDPLSLNDDDIYDWLDYTVGESCSYSCDTDIREALSRMERPLQ